jgi:hypothetical protein
MNTGRLFWLAKLISGAANYLLQAWEWRRRQHTVFRPRATGCLLWLLVLSALACGAFFGIMQIAQAASAPNHNDAVPEGQLLQEVGLLSFTDDNAPVRALSLTQAPQARWVQLLIDNSNSNYDRAGMGTDPDFLRITAARLLLTYLGAAGGEQTHYGSVIFFGTVAEEVVTAVPLDQPQQREAIFNRIDAPPPLGWTDHAGALELALAQSDAQAAPAAPAIVLLTDGKPEWPGTRGVSEIAAYQARLHRLAEEMAARQIPLIIVMLATEASLADAETITIWRPLWQEIAAMTPDGRYFEARTAADLPGIYHELVAELTGASSRGTVIEVEVPATGLNRILPVEAGLAQVTFVIHKADAGQVVRLYTPDSQLLTADNASVRLAQSSHESVWAIDHPPAGGWRLQATGAGALVVWQDVQWLPTPTILPTAAATMPATVAVAVATLPPTRLPFSPTPSPARPTTTLTPAGRTATPAPLPAPSLNTGRSPWSGWPCLLLLPLLALPLLLFGWYRHVQQRPTVSGTLRLLAGPGASAGQHVIDLDTCRQRRFTFGQPESDWSLLGAISQAVIEPGSGQDGIYQMWLTADGNVTVNGRTLTPGERLQLADADLITLDQHRIRYENLQLNRPAFQPAQFQISKSQFRGGVT